MRPPRHSAFFRPRLLDAATPETARVLLNHTRRRIVAWLVVLVVFGLASFGAIYLAHPQRWQREHAKKVAGDQTTTRLVQREPGVAEVEVQRGKEKRTYRIRQREGRVGVEEVKPPPKPKSWWRRLFGQ